MVEYVWSGLTGTYVPVGGIAQKDQAALVPKLQAADPLEQIDIITTYQSEPASAKADPPPIQPTNSYLNIAITPSGPVSQEKTFSLPSEAPAVTVPPDRTTPPTPPPSLPEWQPEPDLPPEPDDVLPTPSITIVKNEGNLFGLVALGFLALVMLK